MRFVRFFVSVSVLCVYTIFLSSCNDKGENRPETGALDIICLGDSITYGYKLADPDLESYPSRLQDLGRGTLQVQNLGVNGATVLEHGDIPIINQEAYQTAMNSHPDVVVLLLGTNDTKDQNWKGIDRFVLDFRLLVNRLQKLVSHPQVIVCSIPPIFIDYGNGLNERHVQQINNRILEAVAGMDVVFLDIHHLLTEKSFLFVDGIHPNTDGAKEIAHFVFDRISTL